MGSHLGPTLANIFVGVELLLHSTLKFTIKKEQNNSLNFWTSRSKKRILNFSLAFAGNQHLAVNIFFGILWKNDYLVECNKVFNDHKTNTGGFVSKFQP